MPSLLILHPLTYILFLTISWRQCPGTQFQGPLIYVATPFSYLQLTGQYKVASDLSSISSKFPLPCHHHAEPRFIFVRGIHGPRVPHLETFLCSPLCGYRHLWVLCFVLQPTTDGEQRTVCASVLSMDSSLLQVILRKQHSLMASARMFPAAQCYT